MKWPGVYHFLELVPLFVVFEGKLKGTPMRNVGGSGKKDTHSEPWPEEVQQLPHDLCPFVGLGTPVKGEGLGQQENKDSSLVGIPERFGPTLHRTVS